MFENCVKITKRFHELRKYLFKSATANTLYDVRDPGLHVVLQ